MSPMENLLIFVASVKIYITIPTPPVFFTWLRMLVSSADQTEPFPPPGMGGWRGQKFMEKGPFCQTISGEYFCICNTLIRKCPIYLCWVWLVLSTYRLLFEVTATPYPTPDSIVTRHAFPYKYDQTSCTGSSTTKDLNAIPLFSYSQHSWTYPRVHTTPFRKHRLTRAVLHLRAVAVVVVVLRRDHLQIRLRWSVQTVLTSWAYLIPISC